MTGSESCTFDNANRIATRQVGASPVTNYQSDADGNTLTDGDRQDTWDSQNRLVSLIKAGKTCDFRYGADGLRRRMAVTNSGQTSPASITHYGYDGTNVAREWGEDPLTQVKAIAATYLMGPSGPMYKRPANAADVRWYVHDGLGSVVGEVDVNGTLLCQKKTDVFGISRGNVGAALSRHGFVGGLGHYSDDETGLIYMRARYYDPSIGRFISQDPKLRGKNWFAYCHSDPVNFYDITGEDGDLVSVTMASGESISLDGLGLSAETDITGNVTRQFADIFINYIKAASKGSFDVDGFLAVFRAWAQGQNVTIIGFRAAGMTYSGELLFEKMCTIINEMGDAGVLSSRANGITWLYWTIQNE